MHFQDAPKLSMSIEVVYSFLLKSSALSLLKDVTNILPCNKTCTFPSQNLPPNLQLATGFMTKFKLHYPHLKGNGGPLKKGNGLYTKRAA